jgi:hypothetical protein
MFVCIRFLGWIFVVGGGVLEPSGGFMANNVRKMWVLAMGEITVLTKATSKSKSLRTTIPMGIVKQFNLSEGDKLNWEIRAEGGELIIVVKARKVHHG